MYEAVVRLVKEHPEWGYMNAEDAVNDAVRDWIRKSR